MVYEQADMTIEKRPTLADDSDLSALPVPVISVAIDDVALASLRREVDEDVTCSVCDEVIEGGHSTGLMMWTRGEEVRFDEPAVCNVCSSAIGVAAFYRWCVGTDDGSH